MYRTPSTFTNWIQETFSLLVVFCDSPDFSWKWLHHTCTDISITPGSYKVILQMHPYSPAWTCSPRCLAACSCCACRGHLQEVKYHHTAFSDQHVGKICSPDAAKWKQACNFLHINTKHRTFTGKLIVVLAQPFPSSIDATWLQVTGQKLTNISYNMEVRNISNSSKFHSLFIVICNRQF